MDAMHGTHKRSLTVKHYLLTIQIAPDARFHCYLMCDDTRYLRAAADRLLTEAEKLGCTYPLMGIVLATRLVDAVETVRTIIRKREPSAEQLFRTATDFHWTIFGTCAGDPADAQLLAIH